MKVFLPLSLVALAQTVSATEPAPSQAQVQQSQQVKAQNRQLRRRRQVIALALQDTEANNEADDSNIMEHRYLAKHTKTRKTDPSAKTSKESDGNGTKSAKTGGKSSKSSVSMSSESMSMGKSSKAKASKCVEESMSMSESMSESMSMSKSSKAKSSKAEGDDKSAKSEKKAKGRKGTRALYVEEEDYDEDELEEGLDGETRALRGKGKKDEDEDAVEEEPKTKAGKSAGDKEDIGSKASKAGGKSSKASVSMSESMSDSMSMSMGKSGKAKSSKSSCLEDEEIEEGAGDEGTDDEDLDDEGTIVDGGIDIDGDGLPDLDLDRAKFVPCGLESVKDDCPPDKEFCCVKGSDPADFVCRKNAQECQVGFASLNTCAEADGKSDSDCGGAGKEQCCKFRNGALNHFTCLDSTAPTCDGTNEPGLEPIVESLI